MLPPQARCRTALCHRGAPAWSHMARVRSTRVSKKPIRLERRAQRQGPKTQLGHATAVSPHNKVLLHVRNAYCMYTNRPCAMLAANCILLTCCSKSLSWSSTLGKPSISTFVCCASLRASFNKPVVAARTPLRCIETVTAAHVPPLLQHGVLAWQLCVQEAGHGQCEPRHCWWCQ